MRTFLPFILFFTSWCRSIAKFSNSTPQASVAVARIFRFKSKIIWSKSMHTDTCKSLKTPKKKDGSQRNLENCQNYFIFLSLTKY